MIPGSANPLLLASAAEAGAYQIERSLRFNSSDSAYLGATFGTPTDQDVFTLSMWVKRSALGSTQHLFGVSTNHSFGFTSGDALNLTFGGSSALTTTALFRDPSAWYHIVWTQNGTSHTIYVNNVSVGTATATSSVFNTAVAHQIGAGNTTNFFSGYLADVHFIDGQALDPTSFGEFDTNGVWQPIAYTGTYGTNGFHLPFSDNSTAAALGTDTSGNSNTWTVNNISVTAGSGNDSLVDTPTNYGTDTGAGGEVRGNYCTWNPLINGDTAANGNLDVTNDTARGTQKLLEYDAYWEITSTGGTTTAGIVSDGGTTNTTTVADGKTYGFKLSAAGSLEYINITDGGSFTSITTGLTGIQFPYASAASATTGSLNAGQRPFAATAPSGYKALCTTNLPDPVVAQPSTVMDVVLWTGDGTSSRSVDLPISADLVWAKKRSGAASHQLADTVRGSNSVLLSNSTGAESNPVTGFVGGGISSISSTAFTISQGTSTNDNLNQNSATFVAWTWDAGSSTVTNTDGSITSTVRANASAGFSIVTYTGTGANATVGHGLGVAPGLVIVKCRSAANDWGVYHSANTSDPKTDYLLLNSTAATADDNTYWNDTAPTSTIFSIGTNADVNTNTATYVAYCFAPVANYSSAFSYTGNGSTDGVFQYLEFRPRLILLKCSSTTGNWTLLDTAREGYNVDNDPLYPNLTNAEGTTDLLDITSNGFKLRTTDASVNSNAATYVGFAWAENPFKYARAR